MRLAIRRCVALCILALAALPALAGVPGPAAIEALLNRTADKLTSEAPEGKGYSYYTYGTKELRYAIGDLDGDGKPEIAARSIYFLGVGSYDLVDIFSDRGNGHERVDFINLYNVDLYDQVESVEIGDGLLTIHTVQQDRGRTQRKSGTFRWQGPDRISPATRPSPAAGRPATTAPAPAAAAVSADNGPDWEYKRIRNIGIAGTRNPAAGIQAFNLYCEGDLPALAVAFTTAQPDPVRLELQVGDVIYPFVLAHQPTASGFRIVNVARSAFPRALLGDQQSAQIRIQGAERGTLSLRNAGAASRSALAGCYPY
ncbi:hypothetical protein [Pseudoxanthomonas koreensis]|uniref:hypothetical protein n=1 Tax=Pseudoxanthomonas koreensis TaxID=266061 RepID=UPI0013917EEB|nr:hypothetical protein [Pseudoxanthomonas koreensis]KAF1690533.1 hypothetical protein CSC64_11245 [Pseudoxanthomonas koreensis]